MEWTSDLLDRLYSCYKAHDVRLREETTAANRSLGSVHPEKVKLQHLTRAEFEALLREEPLDSEVRRLWLRRIVRGHEHDFPELQEQLGTGQIAVIERPQRVSLRRTSA